MLVKIPLISFLIFGVTYPLFFWVSAKDPIKHNFHRFHLACPIIMASLAIFSLCLMPVDDSLKNLGLAWVVGGLLVTGIFWNREGVHLPTVTILCLWGLSLFASVYGQVMSFNKTEIAVSILAGFIVSAIFYAMNLGHFYLNVLGLKIGHLKSSVIVFGILLFIRLLWNIYYASTGQMIYLGEQVSVWNFLCSMEGFMLWVAFFFGTLFPLVSLYFALGTLKLKNTQATTGILYVILSGVLLGDLAYKYFLIKYQIPM